MSARKKTTRKSSRSEPGKKRGTTVDSRDEHERKDHVLQTRISKSMYQDLVSQARRLRVPVSNLVRNILEDSTRMVENIVDSGLQIAEVLSGQIDEQDLSAVLGWQPMIANRSLACAGCGHSIEKSEEAFMSVGAPGGRTLVICGECKCKI